jgi:hypothetical protein
MSAESTFWKILPPVVALVTGLAPIYATYDVLRRGPVPERQVELNRFIAVNPLDDLSPLASRVRLLLTIGDQTFDNIVIATISLKNTGNVPILPSDILEPISVNVSAPWRIIAVEDSRFQGELRFKWKRISDHRYEAIPALLNPGDFTAYTVYVTDTRKRENFNTRHEELYSCRCPYRKHASVF